MIVQLRGSKTEELKKKLVKKIASLHPFVGIVGLRDVGLLMVCCRETVSRGLGFHLKPVEISLESFGDGQRVKCNRHQQTARLFLMLAAYIVSISIMLLECEG
jgi:hypothetical protein